MIMLRSVRSLGTVQSAKPCLEGYALVLRHLLLTESFFIHSWSVAGHRSVRFFVVNTMLRIRSHLG